MTVTLADRIPAITDSLDKAKSDIAEHGVAILSGVLSPSELKTLRDAVYAEAEADRRTGRADDPYFADAMLGNPSQHVWNLPSRSQLYCDLAVHPVVMDLVKSFVGGGIRLSTFSANITLPGSGMMHLHADQGTNPQPWGEKPHGLNFIWCIDDFLDETGATRMVPGSHRLNRSAASMEEIMSETVAVEAPAGSLIVMESRVWHKTGANSTKDRKCAAVLDRRCQSDRHYRTTDGIPLRLRCRAKAGASQMHLPAMPPGQGPSRGPSVEAQPR